MKKQFTLLVACLGILSGCSQSSGNPPTPFPAGYLSTAVALTGQAVFATSDALTASVVPTETFTPTDTPIPPTVLPSSTPTFEPGFDQFAQIRFISPGPMSSLISPINLQVLLIAGESGIVQIDLLGEDGRVLQRDLERIQRNLGALYLGLDLEFEIRAVSEKGYIRISSNDDHHRIQSLNTMPVLLYSLGQNKINPIGNMIYERVMLNGIKEGEEISGGVLSLKGRYWPFNRQPVFVDLLNVEGRPITSRVLNFNGIDPQAFETTLPFKVTERTHARLTFHQDNPDISVSDPELGKFIYVYTQDVVLNP
jgi:hypothetical protein